MSELAIRATALGKRYRLGATASLDRTFREHLYQGLGRLFRGRGGRRQADPSATPGSTGSFLWALREISFDVQHGEILGIIGANGAGKSTLLKILSRITDPTEGEVAIHGTVGSLLEIGTGFHPELTGRENVFLSGAVLGMRRNEIKRKMEVIVSFAEIEKFLDTPVKRYSSGMYVRLAFSVAAHLEPDILIVDEVLAVGDARFQQKCLAKMAETAQRGCTILFVSHNLASVQSLCSRALLIQSGRLISDGDVDKVVHDYLESGREAVRPGVIPESAPRLTNGQARMEWVEFFDPAGEPVTEILFGQSFRVRFRCRVFEEIPKGHFEVSISTADGHHVLYATTIDGGRPPQRLQPGLHEVTVEIDSVLLPRDYTVDLGVHHDTGATADFIQKVLDFSVVKVGVNPADSYRWPHVRGDVRPGSQWRVRFSEASE